jgi:hypothetical protein
MARFCTATDPVNSHGRRLFWGMGFTEAIGILQTSA